MNGGREIRMNASLVSAAFLLFLAGVAFWGAQGARPSVWLFPRLAAGVMAAAGLFLLGEGLRKPECTLLWRSWEEGLSVLGFALAAALYAFALPWLGFWLVSALLVGGGAHLLQPRRKRAELPGWLLVGLVIGLAFDALFVGVFGVPLPGGALWGGAPWRPWLP